MKARRFLTRAIGLWLAASALLALSACAHKDLTAPCGLDSASARLPWTGSAMASDRTDVRSDCGAMRAIN